MPGLSGEIELQSLPLPPSALTKYAKALWYIINTAPVSSKWVQFSYGMQMRPIPTPPDTTPADQWRRVTTTWTNDASPDRANDQQYSFDVVNYTGGQLDNTWTTADHAALADAAVAFANALVAHVCDYLTVAHTNIYAMAFNPYPAEPIDPNDPNLQPYAESGPPVYVRTHPNGGTGVGPGGPQQCSSITKLTAVRAHWGRLYSPTLAGGQWGASGHLGVAVVDALAAAFDACVGALAAQEFFVVVPTTQSDKKRVRALQMVSGVKVDDVSDVIRRRRYASKSYEKAFTS